MHAIAECAEHDSSVVGEPVRHVAIEPAAAIVQRSREIPVVQRHIRHDAMLEKQIDDTVIVRHAGSVHIAGAERQYSAPCDAETVSREPDLAHDLHIVRDAPVL